MTPDSPKQPYELTSLAGRAAVYVWLHDQFEEGGFKGSGVGRMRGFAAIDDFIEYRHIRLQPGTTRPRALRASAWWQARPTEASTQVALSCPGGTLVKYRSLGRTGIRVSPYGLGALMLASQVGNPDPGDSIRVIHRALDAGINLVDTADAYGDSEEVVGRALRGRRDGVVLTTKVSRPMGADPNQQGASRRWIMTAVEGSLRRLQTDRIDVYQIQRPDPDTDIGESLSVLTDLVRSGKIRAFGSSMMPASGLVEAHWAAERRGLERLWTEQPPYSILTRGIEREVLPVAQQYGMGVVVWGPLGQGMLTGRVRRGRDTDVRRAKIFTAFGDERRLDAVERLIPVAAAAGLSMPHLAMAFAISHPGVSCALLGARTLEQLDDLLAGVDVALSDEVLDRIDEIVPPGTDIGTLDQAYQPPAIQRTDLRRRPLSDRSAA
jgi:aryl-alcohol dehydrogenase-like predicted oxidoreductase